jgi:Ca2+-binding EF-hand superfamily protein
MYPDHAVRILDIACGNHALSLRIKESRMKRKLEDDIVLLANEGVLPIEIGHQTGKDKFLNEDKDEMILTETQDRNKNPTYKYITKEEKEFLDKQFTKTMKEYENKDQIKTGGYIPKEIMEEAMNELIGVRGDKNNKKSNFKGLTKKFEDEEEYEDYEFDEDGDQEQFAEEYEEYSEEEEIVDTRKKNKKNPDDEDSACNKSENEDKVEYFENNFKIDYQDGEKKQNKKGKKPPRKPLSKRNDTEIFTIDDLNKLVHDERFVESTIILQEEKEKNPQEENMEGIPVYYPKKRLDITTVHGKVGVLPKTVGEASVKLPKGSFKPTSEHDESKIKNHDSQGKSIVLNSNKPIIPSTLGEETKEEKKLRKKLVKEEKSEKRKQKKELKTAFQLFDKDQDGVISRKELKEMFINLGHDCTDDDIKEIFERFESKDSISFPEFLELATEKRLSQKNLTLELIETFRIFDRDNMNFITADDLRYILKNFCKTLIHSI